MKELPLAFNRLDAFFDGEKKIIKEDNFDWQTLKAFVLTQQTYNRAMLKCQAHHFKQRCVIYTDVCCSSQPCDVALQHCA
jgi:hypothetical protein